MISVNRSPIPLKKSKRRLSWRARYYDSHILKEKHFDTANRAKRWVDNYYNKGGESEITLIKVYHYYDYMPRKTWWYYTPSNGLFVCFEKAAKRRKK